ncbi:hypothetical protein KSP40_PGU003127 [Platanthera guangdongensis]|uniref:Uncharacterized protein n=1 Tax=Platanthera guangdongensis TaxID=2320717 RepID=A0ABR2N2G7_9ASPA
MVRESNSNGHGSFLNASGDISLEGDKVDPMYRMFLEHLRKDGRSYILEMVEGDNGYPVLLKYEMEDTLSDFLRFDAQISAGHGSSARQDKWKPKRGRISKKSKALSSNIIGFTGLPEIQSEKSLVGNCKELISTENGMHSQSNGSIVLPISPNNRVESNCADDSYQEFLSYLKVKDGLMVLQYNSHTVVYEGNETIGTTDSGNQGLLLYEDTLSPEVVICEADDKSVVDVDSCILSSFDVKLRAALSMTYDKKEHESLMKQANYRTPVLRHKDLRSQGKSFSTRKMGVSYLEHFPELAKKLENSEPERALELLRGLFFWLKNVCHEGSHQPWISSIPQVVEVLDQDMMHPLEEQKVEIETPPPLLL